MRRKEPSRSRICLRAQLEGDELSLSPDKNEKIWSFATFEQLMKLLKLLSESEKLRNLRGFCLMNANPMMRSKDVKYQDILLNIAQAVNFPAPTSDALAKGDVGVIITGTQDVAQEIVSEGALYEMLLSWEDIATKCKDEFKERVELRGKVAMLKGQLKELYDPGFAVSERFDLERELLARLASINTSLANVDERIDEDTESRIEEYTSRCSAFVKKLGSTAKGQGVTLITVHSANRIPWFLFLLTVNVPRQKPETIVLQAFLDTRNLGDTVHKGSLQIPGVISFDPSYNEWLRKLCFQLTKRCELENDALCPGQKREIAVIMFAFDYAGLPKDDFRGTTKKKALRNSQQKSEFTFRKWIFDIGRRIHLANRRLDVGEHEDPSRVVIVPFSNGIAICLLGSKSEEAEKELRLDRAIGFAWRVLVERTKKDKGKDFRFRAAVYQASDMLIWAPNGSVTIAGNSISVGVNRLGETEDGLLIIDDDSKRTLETMGSRFFGNHWNTLEHTAGGAPLWHYVAIVRNFVVIACMRNPDDKGAFKLGRKDLVRVIREQKDDETDGQWFVWEDAAAGDEWACFLTVDKGKDDTENAKIIADATILAFQVAERYFGILRSRNAGGCVRQHLALFDARDYLVAPRERDVDLIVSGHSVEIKRDNLVKVDLLRTNGNWLLIEKNWKDILLKEKLLSDGDYEEIGQWIVKFVLMSSEDQGGRATVIWFQAQRLDWSRPEASKAVDLIGGAYRRVHALAELAESAGVPVGKIREDVPPDSYAHEMFQVAHDAKRLPHLLIKVLVDHSKENVHRPLLDLLRGGEAVLSAAALDLDDPVAALEVVPPNLDVCAFGEQRTDSGGAEFERIVNILAPGGDPAPFRRGMAEAELRVAQVVIGGQALGTGFLIGDALLLTCWHVVSSLAPDAGAGKAVARFDYKLRDDGFEDFAGREVSFAENWCVASSGYGGRDVEFGDAGPDACPPLCDFAVVRLAEPVGHQRAGNVATTAEGPVRGRFCVSPSQRDFNPQETLIIFGYPRKRRLQFAFSKGPAFAELCPKQTRVRYLVNTEEGSSGSPVFDTEWKVVALHQGSKGLGGDLSEAANGTGNGPYFAAEGFNQGVPIWLIVAELQRQSGDDPQLRKVLSGELGLQ